MGSRKLARLVEQFVLRRADMVLPIRESLRPYAIALGARPERVRIIPHGTDLEAFFVAKPFDVSREFNIPAATAIISFVGRLVTENYVDDVLELAMRLGRLRADFTVLIAGRGPEEDRLRAAVESDPILSSVVRLIGFQPRNVIAAIRQASRISLCLMGGFSLIEACAAGSAVVAYDVEWHDELVHDGETGFLVVEHDLNRLFDVVTGLLDDATLASRLGKAAQTLAVSRHDIKVTATAKQQCYRELLDA
jgi:glycosyltransferase involved in cell wall biosynthesis